MSKFHKSNDVSQEKFTKIRAKMRAQNMKTI